MVFAGFIVLLLVVVFAGFMVLLPVVVLPIVLLPVVVLPVDIGVDIGVAALTGTTTAFVLLAEWFARLALTLVELPPHAMPRAVIARSEPVAMILFILVSLLSLSQRLN